MPDVPSLDDRLRTAYLGTPPGTTAVPLTAAEATLLADALDVLSLLHALAPLDREELGRDLDRTGTPGSGERPSTTLEAALDTADQAWG